ncbi:hypothetical protein KCP71_13085 [Salmonella enterica subsp. enterica]|nr:hypothetical protein KCP71_13085 [Salmonella enterica subsp. enterica]
MVWFKHPRGGSTIANKKKTGSLTSAKDALNNVRITDEQVLMTPEQLKAASSEFGAGSADSAVPGNHFWTLLPGAIRVCW